MSDPGGLRSVGRRLRGVRARLVAVYLLVAALVAGAGVLVFSILLAGTIRANLDADLRSTAASVAEDVSSGEVQRSSAAPVIDRAHARRDIPTVVAIYDPDGRRVETEPTVLPADPAAVVPRSGLRSVRYDGRTYRFDRVDVARQGQVWTVVVGRSLASTDDAASDARQVLYVIVPVAVLLSGLGAWLLSGAALRPVDRMREDAQLLSETGAPGLIRVPPTSDSLYRLARTFNTLLERMQTAMQRQRDLVADAGHELRTPLSVLQTELETAIRPGRTRADLIDSIRHAQAEATRLSALSEDLLLLAQADGPGQLVRLELVEPAEIVRQCVDAHTPAYRAADVDLRGPDHPHVEDLLAELDPVALRRVLDNLLANALRYTPAGGTVLVALDATTDTVRITVEDTGPGFPADFLPRAFERFARADHSRTRSSASAGSGLGLSIVATLVDAQGGSVSAGNAPDGGARIVIELPRLVDPDPGLV
jgi:two-component system OmpR family sensor kinase